MASSHSGARDALNCSRSPSHFISAVTPQEPHEFDALLRLQTAGRSEVLPFRVVEQANHNHSFHASAAEKGVQRSEDSVMPRGNQLE
jgi:hypothetical protein